MKAEPIILLTRDAAQSQEFAAELGAQAHCVITPLFETEFLEFTLPAPADYFVFTSVKGVEAAQRALDLSGYSAFAVGERTGHAAREAGCNTIVTGANGDDLARELAKRAPAGQGLWIHGEEVAVDLVAHPATRNMSLSDVVAYRRVARPLDAASAKLVQGEIPLLLPLFSPAAARVLGGEMKRLTATSPFELIAISENCAQAWSGPAPVHVSVAKAPNAKEMATLLLERLQSHLVTGPRD